MPPVQRRCRQCNDDAASAPPPPPKSDKGPANPEMPEDPLPEQVEVLSLLGDIALKHGVPSLHAHIVVRRADRTAHGGHLLEGPAHLGGDCGRVVAGTPSP
jgi:hypothetical protein